MDDNGLVLWESRVILTYLCSAYGKDDTYYPADVRTRAVVDQRLQFDLGTLYHRMADYIVIIFKPFFLNTNGLIAQLIDFVCVCVSVSGDHDWRPVG